MWEYRARHLSTLDGDTVRLELDLGFYVRTQIDLRLLDVHAPELGQEGGPETAEFVQQWMQDASGGGLVWPLIVRTTQTSKAEPETVRTFTRFVGSVWGRQHPSLNVEVRAFLAQRPQWGGGK